MDIGRTNKRITFCRYTEKQNELLQTETVLEEIKTVAVISRRFVLAKSIFRF